MSPHGGHTHTRHQATLLFLLREADSCLPTSRRANVGESLQSTAVGKTVAGKAGNTREK